MGAPFTAKNFRIWDASLHALAVISSVPLPQRGGERGFEACIVGVVRQVAEGLRNTPAVCRRSYINPQVFALWRAGKLHEGLGIRLGAAPRQAERLAIKYLRQQQRAAPREPSAVGRPAVARAPPTAAGGRRPGAGPG